MWGFTKAIARALKKYIPDGTGVGDCDKCKAKNSVIRREGCKLCKECGYSVCG
jgi:hypothetical protein